MPLKSYRAELLKQLKDPNEAAEYLNACMSDSEEVFLLALRDVVEASGGSFLSVITFRLLRTHDPRKEQK